MSQKVIGVRNAHNGTRFETCKSCYERHAPSCVVVEWGEHEGDCVLCSKRYTLVCRGPGERRGIEQDHPGPLDAAIRAADELAWQTGPHAYGGGIEVYRRRDLFSMGTPTPVYRTWEPRRSEHVLRNLARTLPADAPVSLHELSNAVLASRHTTSAHKAFENAFDRWKAGA